MHLCRPADGPTGLAVSIQIDHMMSQVPNKTCSFQLYHNDLPFLDVLRD